MKEIEELQDFLDLTTGMDIACIHTVAGKVHVYELKNVVYFHYTGHSVWVARSAEFVPQTPPNDLQLDQII